MHDDDVYLLTPRGEQELHGGRTTITPAEVDLLVRLDGRLTLGQVRAGIGAASIDELLPRLGSLVQQGMVDLRRTDPFEGSFEFTPTTLQMQQATAEAEAAAASLQRAGYFVRIARQGTPRALRPGEKLTAMIVEDEPHLSRFLQHYLSFEGFDVRAAATRAEVVAGIGQPPVPDLVLLDVVLPDADGFDILERIRQHPVFARVRVVMMTARATRESVVRGLAAGADGYVTKPFDAETLVHAVRTVMGLPNGVGGAGRF